MRPLRTTTILLGGITAWALLAPSRACCDDATFEIRRDLATMETLPAPRSGPNDWPCWRGPKLDGVAAPADLPSQFDTTNGVLWKAELNGRGHGSAIIVGEKVLLAVCDDVKQTQSLAAFSRADGKPLWKMELLQGGFTKDWHSKSTHADATPACDGDRVFLASFKEPGIWLTATDLAGKTLWQTNLGEFKSEYGFGASPALWGPLVIVCADQGPPPGSKEPQPPAFMAAVHRKSGQIVWRIRRPDFESFGTPIVPRVAGKDQLLVAGGGFLWSYDPASAEVLWKCAGPTAEASANSPAFSADAVFASGGYPTPYMLIGVRANGRGDVTQERLLFTIKKNMAYVPSPLFSDGLLYVVGDKGVATCLDPKSGKLHWSERLGGNFSASPVRCGDRIFLSSEEGIVHVIKPGTKFEPLARNDLREGILASPAFSADRMFLRTQTKLYCIGK